MLRVIGTHSFCRSAEQGNLVHWLSRVYPNFCDPIIIIYNWIYINLQLQLQEYTQYYA